MYSEGNSRKIKVLLVEDDDDDYVIVRDYFDEIGNSRYELERVASYDEAVALAPECYDVCLLDYRLGSHDGIELMQELWAKNFKCPMIMLTGQVDNEIDRMAMKAGAADYLIKDQINPANLERAMRYSIQQRQFADERINHVREQIARKQAEDANQAKDDFLAVLSHELRTPLNSMLGWARLLKSNKGNDELFDKAVDAIERSAVVQTKFVEDLLDITRIVNGSIRLSMRPVGLNSILEAAVNGLRPTADAKKIALKEELVAEDVKIFGDPERIHQVITNILSNAVKFTPEGGTVSVAATVEGENATVSVTDSGEGIEAEFLPRVFDRYKQAHNSTTNRKGGLGLGLAIVKHLIDIHNGTITVASDGPGTGTTFTFSLPIAPVEDSQEAT